MDLRRLRLFLAVVDHGTFTAAADAELVAQPAVSLAVRELEVEVGAPLLVRSRHGAVLTPAGEALVPPARQALRDIEHATAAVAAVTGLVSGRLDLATLPTLAADPVAELVGRFRGAHPGVTVRLGAPNGLDELADDVRSGRAELGVTEQGTANEGLQEIELHDQELLAVSPPGGSRQRIRLDRLGALPLVLSPPGSSQREVVEMALAAVGVVPQVAVETAQREALIPLVLAGAGTTFLLHRHGTIGPAAARFITLATS